MQKICTYIVIEKYLLSMLYLNVQLFFNPKISICRFFVAVKVLDVKNISLAQLKNQKVLKINFYRVRASSKIYSW
jgi:hypothetical protein